MRSQRSRSLDDLRATRSIVSEPTDEQSKGVKQVLQSSEIARLRSKVEIDLQINSHANP